MLINCSFTKVMTDKVRSHLYLCFACFFKNTKQQLTTWGRCYIYYIYIYLRFFMEMWQEKKKKKAAFANNNKTFRNFNK